MVFNSIKSQYVTCDFWVVSKAIFKYRDRTENGDGYFRRKVWSTLKFSGNIYFGFLILIQFNLSTQEMIFSTEMAIEGNEIKVIDEEIIYTLGK